MAATNELIASGRTDEEVANEIGADWLIYQDLDDLIASTQEGNPTIKNFEMSIFDGNYPTSISADYLEDLESSRGDDQKVAREKSN
jgi:amidophosphoribosyltransferase